MQTKRHGDTFISGPYAIGMAGTWATDGEREASTNGFINSVRWLEERCGMPREIAKEFLTLWEPAQ